MLPHTNEGLRLLIAIRDECHRFATTLNQNQRSSDTRFKLLCSIKGVGEKRAEKIMKEFESIDNIVETPPEVITERTSIPLTVAKNIVKQLSV